MIEKAFEYLHRISWKAMMAMMVTFFLIIDRTGYTTEEVMEIKGRMTLEQIERDTGVPATYLIKGLGLPEDVPVTTPLKELKDRYSFKMEDVRVLLLKHGNSNVQTDRSGALGKGGKRGRDERGGLVGFRMLLYGLLVICTLVFLRAKKISNRLRIWMLSGAVFLFGVLFAARPQPMQSLVEFVKYLAFGQGSLVETLLIFVAFILMAFIGTKLVCGWACPAGGLQELLFRIPGLDKIRIKRIPFWFSNGIRCIIFLIFVALAFGWVLDLKEFVLYRYFNPFKLFQWDFRQTLPVVMISIFGFSVFTYRPYCMFACPFGLFSWTIQNGSLFKIRRNSETCLECKKCSRQCPTEAAEGLLKGKKIMADCFSCARCLNACPSDSLQYKASGWL